MKITLSKVVSFEGNEYKELSLDLDGLTGSDLLKAEREFVVTGGVANVPELSKGFLAIVVARAAKVPIDLIHALPAKDFSRVTIEVQNFLLE